MEQHTSSVTLQLSFCSTGNMQPERSEGGGPCWLLKLRQMETHGVCTNEWGPSSWLVRLARRAGTRDFFPALAALVSQVQNIFSSTAHYFSLFVPIAQQPGQAVVPGHLSFNMCLCMHLRVFKLYKRSLLFSSLLPLSPGVTLMHYKPPKAKMWKKTSNLSSTSVTEQQHIPCFITLCCTVVNWYKYII